MSTSRSDSLLHLQDLLDAGREVVWYNSAAWKSVREAVLRMDHHECQRCKARGRYRRAELVHHVQHLQDRPDLALSVYDPDTGKRQLLSVCWRCHEELHPERALQPRRPAAKPVTEERWD